MPRQARIDAPGALHHIIARGIERTKIFRDDHDRDDFLKRLGKVLQDAQTACYAWALMPNHFHLLLKTGKVPISTVMRRLLTGHASYFNRRHGRSGHLFQNRYRSILCQEDAYLKELVRYIHLNPLRAHVVQNMHALNVYKYSGHGALAGAHVHEWQSADWVLSFFDSKAATARKKYRNFVESGIDQGRQPELIGGGLIRSTGGWENVLERRKGDAFQKSDERILGDSDFVSSVLAEAQEQMERRTRLSVRRITFEKLLLAVANLAGIPPDAIAGTSKVRNVVRARILCCHWAARELGLSLTHIASQLRISVPTVSVAVQKGEALIRERALVLEDLLNVKM